LLLGTDLCSKGFHDVLFLSKPISEILELLPALIHPSTLASLFHCIADIPFTIVAVLQEKISRKSFTLKINF